MKPVFQTQTGKAGNCFSACLASIFEVDIAEVPNFFEVSDDDEGWWAVVRDWLRPRGFGVMFLQLNDPEHLKGFTGYFIVAGLSTRGIYHAVVYKDGVLVHDPHPESTGVVPDGVDMLYPLNPAHMRVASC